MEREFDPSAHEQKVASAYRGSHIVWISLLYCAPGISEATTNYLMPYTIRGFTENALILSIILALNPFFGLVAQPGAGWYSDRIWTPIGRRMPLILFGVVCLALSCVGLPWSQQLADRIPGLSGGRAWNVKGEDIRTGLAVLAFWILVYQCMVDVVGIMVRSIIGDVIPPHRRALAFGGAQIVSCAMIFATMAWGSRFAGGQDEWKWYAIVALIALLCTLPATFLVKEHYVPPLQKVRGEWADYFRTAMRTPYFMRLCVVVACAFVARNLVTNYYSAFTAHELKMAPAVALKPLSWFPIIALAASVPVGWISDRWRRYKLITMAGCLLSGAAGLIGVFATSYYHLAAMGVFLGFGVVCFEVGCNAYLITFMPADKIGQLSGFSNIFQGGPRLLMLCTAGTLIEMMGRNYRIAFMGAIALGVLGALILLPVPRMGTAGKDSA